MQNKIKEESYVNHKGMQCTATHFVMEELVNNFKSSIKPVAFLEVFYLTMCLPFHFSDLHPYHLVYLPLSSLYL